MMKQTNSCVVMSDVTITERALNFQNNNSSFIKSVNIQEFISSNLSFQNGLHGRRLQKYTINHESDDEWQINIDSGELSITEVEPAESPPAEPSEIRDVTILEKCLTSKELPASSKRYCNLRPLLGTKECCVGECFGFCINVCTGGEIRKCTFCDYQSQHLSLYRSHVRHHSEEKRYSCDQCDYSTRKSYSLKSHKRTHTGEKPFVCDLCSFACNDGSTLKRHKYRHTGYKPFSCSKCDYRCTRNSHLQRHIRTHLSDHKFSCDKCEFSCDSKNSLSTHKLEHSDKKLMKCASCEYVTNDRSSLRRHRLIHSEDKPHSCDRCDYKCRRGSHLRRHLKSHERKDILRLKEEGESNPLVCEDCGYFAEHTYVLAVHDCSTEGNRLFHCNRCEFTGKTILELKTHKSDHVKLRLLCNQCPYTSDTFDTLKKHVLGHSRSKKYFCRDCTYSTDHFSSMRKHKLNHSEDYRHKCDICSYSSKRLLNLKRHQEIHKKKHPSVKSKSDIILNNHQKDIDYHENGKIPNGLSKTEIFHDDSSKMFSSKSNPSSLEHCEDTVTSQHNNNIILDLSGSNKMLCLQSGDFIARKIIELVNKDDLLRSDTGDVATDNLRSKKSIGYPADSNSCTDEFRTAKSNISDNSNDVELWKTALTKNYQSFNYGNCSDENNKSKHAVTIQNNSKESPKNPS